MDKLRDMDLFVRVVDKQGLAAAGRELGLSPATVTARINGLEQHYKLKLLNRTTRSITLTNEGREFYAACDHILAEVEHAESRLISHNDSYSGPLRITATIDLGQQHIEPLLSQYVKDNPDISPQILLTDDLVNLAEEGFDLGIRYGQLADSNLVARRLIKSRRVLCASPDYLAKNGTPQSPLDLLDHHCITLIRSAAPMTIWYFSGNGKTLPISISSTRATNDGALMRQWAIEGAGIALKSLWDIHRDIENNKLVILLDNYGVDFTQNSIPGSADLNAVYPERQYLPLRTRGFIDLLVEHFNSIEAR